MMHKWLDNVQFPLGGSLSFGISDSEIHLSQLYKLSLPTVYMCKTHFLTGAESVYREGKRIFWQKMEENPKSQTNVYVIIFANS